MHVQHSLNYTPLKLNIIQKHDDKNIKSNYMPLKLNIIQQHNDKNIKSNYTPLELNIIHPQLNNSTYVSNIVNQSQPSDHSCYILKSSFLNKIYIGYTINFSRRIRQHNGELTGGAKKTKKGRPWYPICLIRGFFDASAALRFEFRLQHPINSNRKKRQYKTRKYANKQIQHTSKDIVILTLQNLVNIINNGDGSIEKDNKMPWPNLNILWYDTNYSIHHPKVVNEYVG